PFARHDWPALAPVETVRSGQARIDPLVARMALESCGGTGATLLPPPGNGTGARVPSFPRAPSERFPSWGPLGRQVVHRCGRSCGRGGAQEAAVAVAGVEQLWSGCAELLRARVAEGTWRTWFEAARPVALDDERLLLSVP